MFRNYCICLSPEEKPTIVLKENIYVHIINAEICNSYRTVYQYYNIY